MGPLTVILKIMLRGLYGPSVDLGWDDNLPPTLHQAWVDVISSFLQVGEIVINRAVKPEGTCGAPELIGFADVSLDAYA